MNNFLKTFGLALAALFVVSCSKDSNTKTVPLRDYATQYATDIANIETFLKTHYMVVVNNPGATNDLDVAYYELPEDGSEVSIWDQTEYPLQTHLVDQNNITYKMYYLQFREGSGANSKSPCNVDKVLTSYRGEYIYKDPVEVNKVVSFQFEESVNPQAFFDLTTVIKGWSEIFPKFKTGSYSGNPDGTISYADFGAGIMFIPSGLAYYGSSKGNIPAYSPLIFSIKLYEVQRVDNDLDGVYSFQEDLDGDGYVRILAKGVLNPDDTDGDSVPDFLDTDDDGDYFTTFSEIKNPDTGESYPFDDIPTCGPEGNGKKKHLDPSCH